MEFSSVTTLPRSKEDSKGKTQNPQCGKEEPMSRSKDLRTSLELADISVGESTICEGVSSRTPQKKMFLNAALIRLRTNVPELKQFCKEEWSPESCVGLIQSQTCLKSSWSKVTRSAINSKVSLTFSSRTLNVVCVFKRHKK